MRNTFGLYIDNLCIDEVVIETEGDEDIQKGSAEYFFRMRMGYNKVMEEKGFEIHLMTENTDEDQIYEISREDRIGDLLDNVDNWSHEDLVSHVRERYRDELYLMDEEELIEAWHEVYSRH